MKKMGRWAQNAFIFVTAIFALALFSVGDVSAAQKATADITDPDSNMLQFRAGNHILGFAPAKAYLASMDHALSVQFIGTKGVMPKADINAPATSAMTKASSLGKVVYQNLWDGISLTYVAAKDGITESTYSVAPGADVSNIRLKYNVPVEMQKDGSIKFKFDAGILTESAPIAWQKINGKRQKVEVAFRMKDGTIGFSVGKYDREYQLIIDPTYQWHTFYGSNGYIIYNVARSIAVDGSGNVYVTGNSGASWNGPAGQLPLNAFSGAGDIFILKLNSGGAYQWHAFYGADNGGFGIVTDGNGNVYVTTQTSEFAWNGPGGQPPLHAWSSSPGCGNVAILKLNSSGTYQWHTFYGPPGNGDFCNGNISAYGIAMDGNGNLYVTGSDWGNWNGPNGQSPLNAYNDDTSNIFVLKLDSNGAYKWHTFYPLSTNGEDFASAIAIEGGGNVFVTGKSSASWNGHGTCSTPGISPCPLNAFSGSVNIFVLKLNGLGGYQWHTFYGADDTAKGIAIDGSGSVYVAGGSRAGWNGPDICSTPGTPPCPLNAYSGSSDVFVLKLGNNGVYQWHTFYGSGNNDSDSAYSIAIDGGNVYMTGTSSDSWHGPNNELPLNALGNFFVLKLNSGGAYQWHTFYASVNNAHGVAAASGGDVYVTGYCDAGWNGPNGQSPLNAYNGHYDFFVFKLNDQIGPVESVRIIRGGSPIQYYASLADAYSAAADGDTIQAQGMVLSEPFGLTLASPIAVSLKGGFNAAFSVNPLMTTLNGSMTISSGKLTVENLVIK
jgi:hypothetical protein